MTNNSEYTSTEYNPLVQSTASTFASLKFILLCLFIFGLYNTSIFPIFINYNCISVSICIVFIPTLAIIIHNLIETKEILNWNTVRCTITQIEDVKDYFTIKGEESYTITKEFDLEYIVNNETIASQTSFGTTLGYNVRNALF